MERIAYKELLAWKQSPHRKPLILRGARQVGKTYLLKDFGKREYSNVAYVNCDNNPFMQTLFLEDYNMERIIRSISAFTDINITPDDTLIIIDEIQEAPKGLGSLKYFCEDCSDYHVAVAGSLLGIALHRSESFPVGKVNFIDLHPMNFNEFLMAKGEDALCRVMMDKDWSVVSALNTKLKDLLRQYYFVGGMPEAVFEYVNSNNIQEVRRIQNEILTAYQQDISKHAPTSEVTKINLVWKSIPSQLAKENKKFVYGALRKGARAVDYETAIQWLIDCGVVYTVSNVTKVAYPLSIYEDLSAFKLFMLDCGLLGCKAGTAPAQMLVGDNIFEEFKGAFTESFVLQQLKSIAGVPVFYYANARSTIEIDFVIQRGSRIVPIEVKAEENLRAKSLRTLIVDNPALKGQRFSMSQYRDQDWMENIPLYAVYSFVSEMPDV